jgi:hypothetical protein
MLVLIVFTLMSFVAIRYVIFYMCVAAPILASMAIKVKEQGILRRPVETLKKSEGILSLITLIAGAALVFHEMPSLARYEFKADTSFAAPKDAADFLVDKKINGNMFNEYGSGGYLIWRLYPDKKVFIDGRTLEPDVYEEYILIASAGIEKNRSWEDIVTKYNITYIVTPPLLPEGEIYPVVEKILTMDEWVLIYSDHLTLIFLRDSPENMSIIKNYSKAKTEGFNTIIFQASAGAMKNKANPYYLITLGKAFFETGRTNDAEKAFLLASRRDPGNPTVVEWLQKVRESRK